MPRLTYVLEFHRPASTTPEPNPIVAASNCVVTIITPVGLSGVFEPLREQMTASLQTTPTPPGSDGSFTEHGVVTFGDPEANNTLAFSSIHFGYMNAYRCPEAPFTAGTVMWAIESGTGSFENATGAITSNFLIDVSDPGIPGELIAYHFGVVYIP
ncbi:MAG TPA: hypothetical protein VNO50_16420 [Pyrinomonadaceae bacterium]|nr:hypothetical protein [Pyrinomonadaceae bacterium]